MTFCYSGQDERDCELIATMRNALPALLRVARAAERCLDGSEVDGWHTPMREVDVIDAIATNAKTALDAQAGVSLDQEAANLLKFQQAFQASGKVMQVAGTLFDSLLQLR